MPCVPRSTMIVSACVVPPAETRRRPTLSAKLSTLDARPSTVPIQAPLHRHQRLARPSCKRRICAFPTMLAPLVSSTPSTPSLERRRCCVLTLKSKCAQPFMAVALPAHLPVVHRLKPISIVLLENLDVRCLTAQPRRHVLPLSRLVLLS